MKKACETTRAALPRYLRGYVFIWERASIRRHLAECAICRSECDALRMNAETRQLLKDLHVTDGMLGSLKSGMSLVARLRLLFYRPVWVLLIAIAAGTAVHYARQPRQLDVEIDRIVQSSATPSAASPDAVPGAPQADTPPAKIATAATISAPAPVARATAPEPERVEPLRVTIVPENDTDAVRRINTVMRGHARLHAVAFSETVREGTATLTEQELAAFCSRIERFAHAKFDRSRLAALPAGRPFPVALKLAEAAVHAPAPVPASAPAAPKPAAPASAPSASAAVAPPVSAASTTATHE
jgi:hypothetical protein